MLQVVLLLKLWVSTLRCHHLKYTHHKVLPLDKELRLHSTTLLKVLHLLLIYLKVHLQPPILPKATLPKAIHLKATLPKVILLKATALLLELQATILPRQEVLMLKAIYHQAMLYLVDITTLTLIMEAITTQVIMVEDTMEVDTSQVITEVMVSLAVTTVEVMVSSADITEVATTD